MTMTEPRRPAGAPVGLDQIVRHGTDGVPITAEEHILSRLKMGLFVHEALEGAGLNLSTYYDWIRKGAQASAKKADGKRLTALERRYAKFANEAALAQSDGKDRIIGTVVGLGVGGLEQTTTTTKTRTVNGTQQVETTVKVERLAPNLAALTWIAERRWAKDWNRREQIELSGPDGGPVRVAAPIAELDQELEAIARRTSGAIDVTSTETTVEDPDG